MSSPRDRRSATNSWRRWWTRRERVRALASVPISIDLVDLVEHRAIPEYRRIADEAYHLRQLGWSFRKIARRFRVDDKTAKKAIAWALEFEPEGASSAPSRIPARTGFTYQRIAGRAHELRGAGASYSEIAAELGVSGPTARRAVRYALGEHSVEDRLSLHQRLAADALRLRQKGWTLGQIAEELGVSTETVAKAISWARVTRR